MKKMIVCIMLLITSATLLGQQIDPAPTLTKHDYLKKSRHQKTAAWWLTGGGLVSTSIGAVIVWVELTKTSHNIFPIGPQPNQKNLDAASAFVYLGLTSIFVSVPFFISARKNKRRAMNLSFKNESFPQVQKNSFVHKNIPSLSLKINL